MWDAFLFKYIYIKLTNIVLPLSNTDRYMLRGVSASKEDVHNAIKNVDKGLFPKHSVKLLKIV
ncbi:MAG: hypothetical protein CM15mP23_20450 [Cryomorphaceae bacterium]|nr:MAG: hypothetical protein CM15mP23_20450 [Cryomorphaceae bacterium]